MLTLQGKAIGQRSRMLTLRGKVAILKTIIITLRGKVIGQRSRMLTLRGKVTILKTRMLTLRGKVKVSFQKAWVLSSGDLRASEGNIDRVNGYTISKLEPYMLDAYLGKKGNVPIQKHQKPVFLQIWHFKKLQDVFSVRA